MMCWVVHTVGIRFLLPTTQLPRTIHSQMGLVERFHRRLKDALQARASGQDLFAHLPWVMLGIHSTWREGTKFSSAEPVYGAQPILPGQFLAPRSSQCPLWEDSHAYWTSFHSRPTAAARRPAPSQTRPGPLAAAYDGPYLVLERSLRYFKLQVGDRTDTFSTFRLKPCRSPLEEQ